MATGTTGRSTEVGKEELVHRPGHRYGLLTDDRGTTLSVHDAQEPEMVWVASHSRKNLPMPIRLDLTQAVALVAMLANWIEDHSPGPEGTL
jgi:hypothetical protein